MRKDEKLKSYNQKFRGYPELHTVFLKMRKDEKQKSYNQKFRGGRALSNEHHESSQKCLLEEISAIDVSG